LQGVGIMDSVNRKTFYVNEGLDGLPDMEDIKVEIVKRGGKVAGQLGPECDVVVVGSNEQVGPEGPLEMALKLVEKGQKLQIIDEDQLLEMLQDTVEDSAHRSDQSVHSFEIGELRYNYCHVPPKPGQRQVLRVVYDSQPIGYAEAMRIKQELREIIKLVDDCGLKRHENCDILPVGWRAAALSGTVVGVNDDRFVISQRLVVLLDSEAAKENGPNLSELIKEFVRIRIGQGNLTARIWDETYVHARRWVERLSE